MLLIVVDCFQVNLEGTVFIQVEEDGALQDWVCHLALDLLDGLGESHVGEAAKGKCLLNHLLAGSVQVWIISPVYRRGIEGHQTTHFVGKHAGVGHCSFCTETVPDEGNLLAAESGILYIPL